MHNKISALPITLDRKATVYEGVGDEDTYMFIDDLGNNVTLCSDGTNVEYWLSFLFDSRRPPLPNLQIDLDITVEEFLECTQGQDTYVDLILVDANKVAVHISTQLDEIYNKVHTVR